MTLPWVPEAFQLAWPWMLTLLPLPVLMRMALPTAKTAAPALLSRFYARLAAAESTTTRPATTRIPLALMALMWIALTLAAARPQWLGDPIAIPATGRDLLLAVDISESMQMEDMLVNDELYPRLTVVKDVVGEFVKRRTGDKLGLILFGSQAYLQTPLTFDRQTLNTLLQEAKIGFAGPATAIGDAIGIAIKRLESRPENSRVLILLSDGADTASELPPRKAAELAASHHIRIYTIGIGADALVRRSFLGARTFNPSADLDEDMLTAIAETTGGKYFRARDPEQLKAIYALLDSLEPVAQEEEILRPSKALFHWPLAVAFCCFVLIVGLRTLRSGDD
ncbi:MAG: VWA domain-containing protein [Porticoccaceae bacterium]